MSTSTIPNPATDKELEDEKKHDEVVEQEKPKPDGDDDEDEDDK